MKTLLLAAMLLGTTIIDSYRYVAPPASGLELRSASVTSGTGTNITATEPSGAAENDILLAVAERDGNGSIGAPSGWTVLDSGIDAFDSFFGYNVAWIRRGASAPDLTWTVGASVYREVRIACISGAITSGSPIEAETNDQDTVSDPDAPSVTTLTVNAMVVAVSIYKFTAGSGTGGWGTPANYTFIGDNTAGLRTAAAYRVMPSTGAENPGAFTNRAGDGNWRATSVSIEPQ